jgi:hypothetical protein
MNFHSNTFEASASAVPPLTHTSLPLDRTLHIIVYVSGHFCLMVYKLNELERDRGFEPRPQSQSDCRTPLNVLPHFTAARPVVYDISQPPKNAIRAGKANGGPRSHNLPITDRLLCLLELHWRTIFQGHG